MEVADENIKLEHGGARPQAGRKTKAEEANLLSSIRKGILASYGSDEELWIHIANESKTSPKHLQLLIEYYYGKAKEKIDHTTNGKEINIPVISWVGNS